LYTGIITDSGVVSDLKYIKNQDLLIKIAIDSKIKRKLEIGCSIAINGVCQTLIAKEKLRGKIILSFQASNETLRKTTIKNWQIGNLVNVEFSLRIGDELGGHIILGHVDNIAEIITIKKIKASHKIVLKTKKDLLKFIVKKGSICLDGVSLTVNEVKNDQFSINLIPYSFANTNFKILKEGDLVNLEIDPLARYLKRLINK
jgi:riboflavin synthase